jgi:hypothetical protein
MLRCEGLAMPWYEKDHLTPFDAAPIPGVAFLHGDVLARQYGQAWVRGKKYPLLTFPAGTARELISYHQAANMHLFGSIALPASGTYEAAFQTLAAPHQALHIYGDGKRNLMVVNPATHRGYGLTFDNETGKLTDLVSLPKTAMELLPGELRAILPPFIVTKN